MNDNDRLNSNIDIYNRINNGEAVESVAKEYELSAIRVYQIYNKMNNRFDVFSLKHPWFYISLTKAALELNLSTNLVDKIYKRLSGSMLDSMLGSDEHPLEYWLDYASKYYYGFGSKSVLLTERALQLYFDDFSKTENIAHRQQERIVERLNEIDRLLLDLDNRSKKLIDERHKLVLEYKKNLRSYQCQELKQQQK